MQSLFPQVLWLFGDRFISAIMIVFFSAFPFLSATAALPQVPWGLPLSTLEQKQRCRETEILILECWSNHIDPNGYWKLERKARKGERTGRRKESRNLSLPQGRRDVGRRTTVETQHQVSSSVDRHASDPNSDKSRSQSPGHLSDPGENLRIWASFMAMGALRNILAPWLGLNPPYAYSVLLQWISHQYF